MKLGAKQDEDRPTRLKLGLATISPRSYEPNYKLLHKTLFGKEPDVNPYTGGLVYAPGRAAQAGPGSQQAGPTQSK